MPDLPDPREMPKVPEPLQTPASLGGLAERAGIDTEVDGDESDPNDESDSVMESLRERTGEWTEDIDEKEKVIFRDKEDTEEAMEDPTHQQVDANEV